MVYIEGSQDNYFSDSPKSGQLDRGAYKVYWEKEYAVDP